MLMRPGQHVEKNPHDIASDAPTLLDIAYKGAHPPHEDKHRKHSVPNGSQRVLPPSSRSTHAQVHEDEKESVPARGYFP